MATSISIVPGHVWSNQPKSWLRCYGAKTWLSISITQAGKELLGKFHEAPEVPSANRLPRALSRQLKGCLVTIGDAYIRWARGVPCATHHAMQTGTGKAFSAIISLIRMPAKTG